MILCVLLLALMANSSVFAYHGCGKPGEPCERDPQILPVPMLKEDFQFELRNVYTNRQRGARLNVFVKFRYYTTAENPAYTTETRTYDYRDMKEEVIKFIPADVMDLKGDSFWEIVNRDMCIYLWKKFPIKGLSVRMEVQGMSSGGIAGHRASTVTMGDMEPFVSMVNNFAGCDGMDTNAGNAACRLVPTWPTGANSTGQLERVAKAKTGKHDKPKGCNFCSA